MHHPGIPPAPARFEQTYFGDGVGESPQEIPLGPPILPVRVWEVAPLDKAPASGGAVEWSGFYAHPSDLTDHLVGIDLDGTANAALGKLEDRPLPGELVEDDDASEQDPFPWNGESRPADFGRALSLAYLALREGDEHRVVSHRKRS